MGQRSRPSLRKFLHQLHKVAVTVADPELFAMDGFQTPAGPPTHAIYPGRVDVSIYPIDFVKSGS